MTKLFSAFNPVSLLSLLALGACGVLVDNSPGLNDGKEDTQEVSTENQQVTTQEVKSLLSRISGIKLTESGILCQDKDGKITVSTLPTYEGSEHVLSTLTITSSNEKGTEASLELINDKAVNNNDDTQTLITTKILGKLTDIKELSHKSFTASHKIEKSLVSVGFQEPKETAINTTIAVTLTETDDAKFIHLTMPATEGDASCGKDATHVGSQFSK